MRRLIYLHVLGLALAGMNVPARAADPRAQAPSPTRKLYLNKCAKCHKLYDPAKYSDAEWEMWMGKMTRKARLKDEQQQQLMDYIQSTLRHPSQEPQNLAEPKGRKAVQEKPEIGKAENRDRTTRDARKG